MFKIAKKTDYGVFLLAYLARHEGRVVSAQELTQTCGIHRSVVANILKDLTRAGILRSVRGTHGGYLLARNAQDIALKEILEVMEGPVALVECGHPAENRADSHGSLCALLSMCPSTRPMRMLQDKIVRLLQETRLSDLARGSHCAPAPLPFDLESTLATPAAPASARPLPPTESAPAVPPLPLASRP